MSNLRPCSLSLSEAAIHRTINPELWIAEGLHDALALRELDSMQFVAGTPTGAAILIERFRLK
jgi:hypothetical protein